jgi:hypothetical protein
MIYHYSTVTLGLNGIRLPKYSYELHVESVISQHHNNIIDGTIYTVHRTGIYYIPPSATETETREYSDPFLLSCFFLSQCYHQRQFALLLTTSKEGTLEINSALPP